MPKDSVRPPTRGSQLHTSGLGIVFTSPKKRRDKKKSTTFVAPIGSDMRQQHLLAKIQRLKAHRIEEPTVDVLEGQLGEDSLMSQDATFDTPSDNSQESSDWVDDGVCVSERDTTTTLKSRRLLPNTTTDELYARWMATLPRLVPSLTSYITRTTGVPLEPITNIQASCIDFQNCERKSSKILCLFVDRKLSIK